MVRPTTQDRLDCLEVFDFCYLFALRKVVPPKYAWSWQRDRIERWYRVRSEFLRALQGAQRSWFLSTVHMRRCLQRSCVADLITQQTWKMKDEEAPRKTLDLLRLGGCAIGDTGDNWFQPAGRCSMIDVLKKQERGREFDKEDYSWWDRFRLQADRSLIPISTPQIWTYSDFLIFVIVTTRLCHPTVGGERLTDWRCPSLGHVNMIKRC